MREQEMRLRVFQFLKARMRNMLMPATLGIGLAVGGCAKEGVSNQTPDSAADTAQDSSQPVTLYGISFPDGSFPLPDGPSPDLAGNLPEVQVQPDAGLPRDVPIYGSDTSPLDLRKADGADAAAPVDQAVAIDGAAIDGGKPADAGPDLGGIITKYIAPIPDAGVTPDRDAGSDAGGIAPVYIAPLYIAQMPDGAAATRYLAQMPDSGVVTPLYMAPQTS